MLKIDLHIHSIASGHAYGTIYDIIKEALRKKMALIAITDHGPSMEGSAEKIHFKMGYRAPKRIGNLRVLWGCEANIIDESGRLDLDDELLARLGIVLMAMHRFTAYHDRGIKLNTQAVKKALENPYVKILSHPEIDEYPLDYEAVWGHALDKGVLLELNLASFRKQRGLNLERMKKMIALVKSRRKRLIVNSDAHFIHEIGDDSILKKYWRELGLSKELILNNHADQLNKILER